MCPCNYEHPRIPHGFDGRRSDKARKKADLSDWLSLPNLGDRFLHVCQIYTESPREDEIKRVRRFALLNKHFAARKNFLVGSLGKHFQAVERTLVDLGKRLKSPGLSVSAMARLITSKK